MDEHETEKLVYRIAAEFGITDQRGVIAGPDGWRMHRLSMILSEAFMAGVAETEARAAYLAAKEFMSGKLTIACKVACGLRLRLFDMVDVDEPGPAVARTVKQARQRFDIPDVVLQGPGRPDLALLGAPAAVGGYGLTHGVDADFWAEWLRQNHDHFAVINKLVFAHEKEADATAAAKDHASIRSGMEPMVPRDQPTENGDPRSPLTTGQVGGV